MEAESPAARDLRNPPDHRLHLKRVGRAADGGGHADLRRCRVYQSRLHKGAPDHVGVPVGGRQRNLRSGRRGALPPDLLRRHLRFQLHRGAVQRRHELDGAHTTPSTIRARSSAGSGTRPRTRDGSVARAATVPSEDGSAYVAFAGYEGEEYPFQTARYVRLTSAAAGLKLGEVAFLDADGNPQSATSRAGRPRRRAAAGRAGHGSRLSELLQLHLLRRNLPRAHGL